MRQPRIVESDLKLVMTKEIGEYLGASVDYNISIRYVTVSTPLAPC